MEIDFYCACCGQPVPPNSSMSRKYCKNCAAYLSEIKRKEQQKLVSYRSVMEKKLRRLLEILPFDIDESEIN